MGTGQPPDVVGRAPVDATALLEAAGWRVRRRPTGWRGHTPGDIGGSLVVPRVVATRIEEGVVDLIVARFPGVPTSDAGITVGESG